MCVAVNLHVNLLMESFATVGTRERFKVGMSAHVRVQVGSSVECFVARGADVWFDCSVRQSMTC